MGKPREWWIEPDYEGYFDDTDENLLQGGFIKAIEKSAYDRIFQLLQEERGHGEKLWNRINELKRKLREAGVEE